MLLLATGAGARRRLPSYLRLLCSNAVNSWNPEPLDFDDDRPETSGSRESVMDDFARRDSYGGSRGNFERRDSYGGSRGSFDRRNSYGGSRGNFDRREGGGFRRSSNSFAPSRYAFSASLERVDFSKIELPPVKKQLYEPSESVLSMSPEEAKKWRKTHGLAVAGLEPIPNPVTKFADINMPEFVRKQLQRKGFDKPSPIQAMAWPVALSGRDMIGISATGSGKTLAFALPGIMHIMQQPHLSVGGGPISLVLVPTRELANQVRAEWDTYAGSLRSAALFGGQGNRQRQITDLRNGAHTVIACPGRLKDLVQQGMLSLRRVSYVVLDEADRMLDMGFEPQVREILGQVRPERQTMLWSATWPTEVQQLARDFLSDPVAVTVGSIHTSANKDITQQIEFCSQFEKTDRLVNILNAQFAGKKVLIFVQTKAKCGFTVDDLRRKGVNAYELHGDLTQAVRDRSMEEFRHRRDAVLVATDVAARGIDVRDIAAVVNLDFPQNIEQYVHRIGRTGRAGDKGTAISFMTPYDNGMARDLIKVMEEAQQRVPAQLRELIHSQRQESEAARTPRGGQRSGSSGRSRTNDRSYQSRSSDRSYQDRSAGTELPWRTSG